VAEVAGRAGCRAHVTHSIVTKLGVLLNKQHQDACIDSIARVLARALQPDWWGMEKGVVQQGGVM
jgi:hypothetical protein